jgi:hypothetical protein
MMPAPDRAGKRAAIQSLTGSGRLAMPAASTIIFFLSRFEKSPIAADYDDR